MHEGRSRSVPQNAQCAWMNVAVFAATALVLLLAILRKTHGHFTYCLDDPYIHLALADRLRHGLYGINAGEAASPSSSILWPLLLVPFAGTRLMPWMPLLLNLGCSGGTAWLLGRFVDRTFAAGWRARLLAVLLLVATNVFGLVFTGLEHPLEVLLCVAGAFAVLAVLEAERVPWGCVLAAAVLPSVRYEGLLITFAVAVALWASRQRLAAGLLLPVSLVPVAGFSVFLHRLGLPWFPLSVLVKSSYKFADQSSLPVRVARLLVNTLTETLENPERAPQLLLVLVLGYFAWRGRGAVRLVLAAGAAAGAVQVVVGPVGWFFRYEVYCLAFSLVVAIAAEARFAEGLKRAVVPGTLLVLVGALAMFYARPQLGVPQAALGIYEEQTQLGRFAAEFYTGPVAVNDLGWVAFDRGPRQYVLDLVGLGSYESFKTKERDRTPEWLEAITREHGVGVAMLYPEWFAKGVPATWVPVAKLCAADVDPVLGAAGKRVMFYATPVADRAAVRQALARFGATLPGGSSLELNPIDSADGCRSSH